jgi:hypothetical protein
MLLALACVLFAGYAHAIPVSQGLNTLIGHFASWDAVDGLGTDYAGSQFGVLVSAGAGFDYDGDGVAEGIAAGDFVGLTIPQLNPGPGSPIADFGGAGHLVSTKGTATGVVPLETQVSNMWSDFQPTQTSVGFGWTVHDTGHAPGSTAGDGIPDFFSVGGDILDVLNQITGYAPGTVFGSGTGPAAIPALNVAVEYDVSAPVGAGTQLMEIYLDAAPNVSYFDVTTDADTDADGDIITEDDMDITLPLAACAAGATGEAADAPNGSVWLGGYVDKGVATFAFDTYTWAGAGTGVIDCGVDFTGTVVYTHGTHYSLLLTTDGSFSGDSPLQNTVTFDETGMDVNGVIPDFHNSISITFNSAVPEPASCALFGLAMGGLGLIRRRRRRS